jgi:hypothetical protein
MGQPVRLATLRLNISLSPGEMEQTLLKGEVVLEDRIKDAIQSVTRGSGQTSGACSRGHLEQNMSNKLHVDSTLHSISKKSTYSRTPNEGKVASNVLISQQAGVLFSKISGLLV